MQVHKPFRAFDCTCLTHLSRCSLLEKYSFTSCGRYPWYKSCVLSAKLLSAHYCGRQIFGGVESLPQIFVHNYLSLTLILLVLLSLIHLPIIHLPTQLLPNIIVQLLASLVVAQWCGALVVWAGSFSYAQINVRVRSALFSGWCSIQVLLPEPVCRTNHPFAQHLLVKRCHFTWFCILSWHFIGGGE